MDTRLLRIKELIEQKECIDTELESLIGGAPMNQKRPPRCTKCKVEGHTARTCPQQQPTPDVAAPK
jgi:hypothetical protein